MTPCTLSGGLRPRVLLAKNPLVSVAVQMYMSMSTSRFAPSFEREDFNGGVDLFHPRVYYI